MTPPLTASAPLPDLVEESLDEALFLWKRWEADLASLTRNLAAVVTWSEDRLQGALDGVRVSGHAIVRATSAALASSEPSRLSVVAHLLSARSPPEARAALAAALGAASGPRLWAMIRGVEVAVLDGTFTPVTAALANGGPERAAALCRLKAFRRAQPGPELARAFESGVPLLQVEALRAVALSAEESLSRFIQLGLKSGESSVRQAAISAGIRRGVAAAWDAAVALTHARDPEAAAFIALLAALGSAEEQQMVLAGLRVPALRQAALAALGHIGTPEAVEICLKGMQDPQLARSAAEAYCTITGAELQRDHLLAPQSADAESPPPLERDNLDADLVPPAHELWPLPDVAAVGRHWERIKPGYQAGVRYLLGRRADPAVLMEAIESGPMLRRPEWIAELAARTGGRYDVEPRAFAHVQRRMMSAARGALAHAR